MIPEYQQAWRELFDRLHPDDQKLIRQKPEGIMARKLALDAMRRAARAVVKLQVQ